ncbi:MAG: DNA translocase FtsK [Bacteroidales bacterium]|jgi:S-DNA-T family DNA segregation ATPase FtsK/SpoIIIE|nr:DNA translocase FtsK [Bacteroidales bacterium]
MSKNSKVKKEAFYKSKRFKYISTILLIAIIVFVFMAMLSYLFTWMKDFDKLAALNGSNLFRNKSIEFNNALSRFGAIVGHALIYRTFGLLSFGFIPIMIILTLKIWSKALKINFLSFVCKSLFIMTWASVVLALIFRADIFGGVIGYEIVAYFSAMIGKTGIIIALLVSLLLFLVVAYNFMLNTNFLKKDDDGDSGVSAVNGVRDKESNFEAISTILTTPTISDFNINRINEPEIVVDEDESVAEIDVHGIDTPYNPYESLSRYQFPTLDLLEEYKDTHQKESDDVLVKKKELISSTLKEFGVDIETVKATVGATVTLYEIEPAKGVRISKIKSLEDEIALNLRALGIRIIAPMPGKGTIGIEVPNEVKKIVPMRALLASQQFKDTRYDLPLVLGRTIQSENFVIDLAKSPHVLMAGATGQGKSVGINAIVASLLYKKHPADLKFVFVDPKKVELSLYEKIENHFLAKIPDSDSAIITDTQKVVKTLKSLCAEMDKRYDLLKAAMCKNIKEYNTKFVARKLNPLNGHFYMPYIVLVIDEFADLIMTAGKEIEMPIARLAQLARAVGLHLIIATQRPSVKIITGTIKANFPARIAFKVAQRVDSLTIIDTKGAEQLIGRGDMLYAAGIDLIRLQCALLDTPEIERIVNFIGNQQGYPDPYFLPEVIEESGSMGEMLSNEDRDTMFTEAAELFVTSQNASTSLLQRKMKIGFARAGRITDQLELSGIISPMQNGKREVLISDLESLHRRFSELA